MLQKKEERQIVWESNGRNPKERPFQTKLCTLLNIEYPIIQGALGGIGGPEGETESP